jgi:hypothetical protein
MVLYWVLDHVGAPKHHSLFDDKHRLLKKYMKKWGFKRLKNFRATKGGAFTPNVKSVLSENLGGTGTQC